jgi:YVTN family beta-propeller protein
MRPIRFVAILLLLSVYACKKDAPSQEPISEAPVDFNALVVNEGNFQWGNASMSHINLSSGVVTGDVFSQANQRPLGDVFQSIAQVNSDLWLLVNNSQKIERIDKATFIAKSPITGLQSPRYMVQASNKVYVTDLYSNSVHVLHAATGESITEIPFPGWSEGIVLDAQSNIWVSNVTRGKLMKIDPQTDMLVDSIAVGDAPRMLCTDDLNRIWVLCEGHLPPAETGGSLWCINPTDGSVVRAFHFSETSHPARLLHIPGQGKILFLDNGLFSVGISDTVLPATPFIAQGNRLFYGMGYNVADQTIWVSDAKDFQQSGDALVFKGSTGEFIRSFSVGIIPGSFYFY